MYPTKEESERLFWLAFKLKMELANVFVDMFRKMNPESCSSQDLGCCIMACNMLTAGSISAMLTPENFSDVCLDKTDTHEIEGEILKKLTAYTTQLILDGRADMEAARLAKNYGSN